MKYYVTADVHGYYSLLRRALTDAGYFDDPEPHRLVVLGDLLDRGPEAAETLDFVQQLMKEGRVILVRGNHEDLFVRLVTADEGQPLRHHIQNCTYDTALQLTGYTLFDAKIQCRYFASEARKTAYYREIIPAMADWFETEHYVFTHGWIPCVSENGVYRYRADWRSASEEEWADARWLNGMDAAPFCEEEKTVLCGHWHASYGHFRYEHKGAEFGPEADFSPYYGKGIIALDACTAVSGRVNVVVLEDQEIHSPVPRLL